MTDTTIATVGDLIAALVAYEPATPVRIATESAEVMDHTIGRVVCTPGDSDSDSDCVLPNDAPVVRISTGTSYCCLPRQCRRRPRVVMMPATTTPAALAEPHSAGKAAAARLRPTPERRCAEAMSTKTDFYVGRGQDAEWVGSLQADCAPENLLCVPPGRLTLTAADEATYRAALADLFLVWESEKLGTAYTRRTGWPWPWPTSHVSSWIVTFDPAEHAVFVTIGGGVRWERIDPHHPREPATDGLGALDLQTWLRAPAEPPSVPLPLMRDPRTGLPTPAGRHLTHPDHTRGERS